MSYDGWIMRRCMGYTFSWQKLEYCIICNVTNCLHRIVYRSFDQNLLYLMFSYFYLKKFRFVCFAFSSFFLFI